jgi:hypothetical protein
VDVRIASARRRRPKADKGRELAVGNVGPAGALAVVGVCCCTEGRATALAVAIGARSATHPPPIDLVAKL